eukprot:3722254-Rhodomonas_salina.1
MRVVRAQHGPRQRPGGGGGKEQKGCAPQRSQSVPGQTAARLWPLNGACIYLIAEAGVAAAAATARCQRRICPWTRTHETRDTAQGRAARCEKQELMQR